jgi:hypothetical protein
MTVNGGASFTYAGGNNIKIRALPMALSMSSAALQVSMTPTSFL